MIYTAAIVAALAGIAAASPAPVPQMLDFAAISTAPSVAVGPTGLAIQQNASVISAVTVTATAAPGATGLSKRNPKWGLMIDAVQAWECLFFHICSTSAVASTTRTSTSTAPVFFTSGLSTTSLSATKPATTAASTTSVSQSTSAAQSTSSATSTTAGSVSGTSTTSSSTACPTQPEAGTYCGFINPEDPCAPQPDGYGPKNQSVSDFESYPPYHAEAQAAPAVVPSVNNTAYVQVFRDLNASVSANSYISLYTLQNYSVAACAAYCDSTDLCTAFNLYIERDPQVNPSTNASTAPTVWGRDCPNPASVANYKCTLWGSNINSTMATNYGQYREQFQVVIVASDGYDKTDVTSPVVTVSPVPSPTSTSASVSVSSTSTSVSVSSTSTLVSVTSSTATATATTTPVKTPTWGNPHNCGGKGVNNGQHFMSGRYFPGPFNAQLCADFAMAQNAANKAAAVAAGKRSWTPCTYINAAYYNRDGVAHGTQCNLYDVAVDSSFETYVGGYSGGHNFGCAQSFTFQLQVDASFSTC